MRRLCGLPPGVVLATVWSRADSARDRGSGHLAVHRSGRRALGAARRGRPAAGGKRPAAAPAGADAAAGAPAGSGPDRCLRRRAGPVHAGSPASAKVAFYASLFAARPDVYAVRWENARTGRAGWVPAVRGGWRKGVPAAERGDLPLTEEVITAHLSGELELGLYPLLDGDHCHWLPADFDGSTAVLDALAYLKAARAAGASAALEVSRSGLGVHVWLFFTGLVPAATARQLGSGLLREAIAVRGRMDLASYDRLFPRKTSPEPAASAT